MQVTAAEISQCRADGNDPEVESLDVNLSVDERKAEESWELRKRFVPLTLYNTGGLL